MNILIFDWWHNYWSLIFLKFDKREKYNKNCRVLIRGVLHCRCEWTQTQYNEFGREAGSRTGPLWGLRQRLGRIVRERDHQRRRGGVKVYPRASSEDEFFFSSSNTSRLELSGVFRIAIPLSSCDLSGYISFCSLHLGRPFIDRAGRYLNICPIQRFPQLAVSYGRQDDTVQGSFLH